MRILRWAGMVAAAWAVGSPASMLPRLAADEKFDANALYEKCVKSCAFVSAPFKGGHAHGDGSLIDAKRRLVLTNAHVVGDADSVFVQFPEHDKDGSLVTKKRTYLDRVAAATAPKGKVVFRDPKRDLALVELEKLPPDTQALPLAATSPRVGDELIQIGSYGGVDVTFATIKGTVRSIEVADFVVGGSDSKLQSRAKIVMVTNPIGPQGSGGPWIDKRGHQVAVAVTACFGAIVQSVNLAIDATEVRAFLTDNKVELPEPKADPAPKK